MIPWITIRMDALKNLLNDFIIKINTMRVMWLIDEKAIRDLWSDCSRQKVALKILPISRKKINKFSNKGGNKRDNR